MESQLEDWNKIHIPSPPNVTLLYSWEEDGEVIHYCLPILEASFSSLGTYLSSANITLMREFKIFIGLLPYYQTTRKEKYHNLALKIKKCVKRINEVKIYHYLTMLSEMVPSGIKHGAVRLPTRQLFEYLLIKILGVFKLLLTVEKLCKEIGKILIGKIRTGHDYWIAMPILAAAARIRVLTLIFAQKLALFYEEVMPVVQCLKGTARFGLSENTSLVQELKNLFRYEKEVDKTRSSTSGEIELGILDIFKDSEDMIGMFNFKTENGDFDHSLNNELQDSVNIVKDKASLSVSETVSVPEINNSKNSMSCSELQGKQKIRDFEKEKEILSLLDIFSDIKDKDATECISSSFKSNMNTKGIDMSSISSGVDSLMKSDDLGEVVESVTTENKVKKIKQKKKRVIVSKISKKAVGIKGKNVKKKKILLDQSETLTLGEGSAKNTVNDVERSELKDGKKRKIGKKKKILDLSESIAIDEKPVENTANDIDRRVLKEGKKDKVVKKKKKLLDQCGTLAVSDIGRIILKDGNQGKIVKKKKKLIDHTPSITISGESAEGTVNDIDSIVLKEGKKKKKLLDQTQSITTSGESAEGTVNDIDGIVLKEGKKKKKLLDQTQSITISGESAEGTVNDIDGIVLKEGKKKRKLLDQTQSSTINGESAEGTVNDIDGIVLKERKKKKKLLDQTQSITISGESAEGTVNDIDGIVLKEGKKKKKI